MLLIDDILLFPIRGVVWCCREIHKAAQAEVKNEEESFRAQLVQLYMQLETGRISETDFDAQEKQLLDKLDRLEDRGSRVLGD